MRQGTRVREPAIRAIEGTDRPRLPHESHGFPHGSRGLLRRVPAEEGQWLSDEWREKEKTDPSPPFSTTLMTLIANKRAKTQKKNSHLLSPTTRERCRADTRK